MKQHTDTSTVVWKPDPWPRRNADAAVLDGNSCSGSDGGHRQDIPTYSTPTPKQNDTRQRAQKRKCCDASEETIKAPHVCNTPSTMCRALTKAPQYLYTVGGEAVPGARSSLQASGALWSTDSWIEQPCSWQEHKVSVVDPSSVNTGITRTMYDKCFCAEWITNTQLAVSTKCGHVLRVDRDKKTYKEIEILGQRWIEPPIVTEEDLHRYRVDRGGIHALSANRAKHLLACSGCRDDDNNVYVLDMMTDKWKTIKSGEGHKDWVFTLSWISDHVFVTGGRDKSVLLWNPLQKDDFVMHPIARYDVHNTKVRCSSFDRDTERLITMDVGGNLKLWDAVGTGAMRVVRRFQIPDIYKEECTCMLLSENMLLAGAREAVTIYDPRRPVSVLSVPLARMSYWQAFPVSPPSVAARSIAVHGCMISIGLSTGGTLICLDKRMLGGGPFETKIYYCKAKNPVADSFAGAPPSHQPAHTSLATPPVKAMRYNLRQRSKLKMPPRFDPDLHSCTSTQSDFSRAPDSYGASAVEPDMLSSSPKLPCSTHVLDLARYITPKAILKQPHGDVHVDDIISSTHQVENAIFSHSWSPDGCALFSCGGPLAMGVRGCYMALWC